MALALNDRVQQTGTANTTVSFTLTSTVLGFQDFSVVGNGNTTYYAATDATGNWEVGVGTYSTSGPTLTRTTILASSNTGSAETFSGTVNVWVTYPSEQVVILDASGNVTALGTITSGTWQGSTIGVAYGGTGVTASSGPNSVVLRNGYEDIVASRISQSVDNVSATGGTTDLTAASKFWQTLTGTSGHTFKMPDATTLPIGFWFIFDNDSTGTLVVQDFATSQLDIISPGGYTLFYLDTNATVAGGWNRAGLIPSEVNWGTNNLDLGGLTTVTNGTWQGAVVDAAYGGTGLSSFSAANYALYSTSASTLTAGTLPVAAGGTGTSTAFTTGSVVFAGASGEYSQDNENLFWDDSENRLGIGTAVPSSKLHVLSDDYPFGVQGLFQSFNYRAAVTTTNDFGVLSIGVDDGDVLGGFNRTGVAGGGFIWTDQERPIAFFTNNLERMRITPYGGLSFGPSGTAYGTPGQVLTSNGDSDPTWEDAGGGAVADGCIYENNLAITSNYTLTTGKNGMSVGPITVASGVSVTVPSGQRWVIL